MFILLLLVVKSFAVGSIVVDKLVNGKLDFSSMGVDELVSDKSIISTSVSYTHLSHCQQIPGVQSPEGSFG